MLRITRSMGQLPFGQLMEVYAEGNLENGREFWPDLSEGQQLLQAEQEFYQYLREVFFQTAGAAYYLWEHHGKPVSALRLEPYRDGLLLEALETHPLHRRKGYAKMLIKAALEVLEKNFDDGVFSCRETKCCIPEYAFILRISAHIRASSVCRWIHQ